MKRKPLPLNDDSHFQLKRAKQFKPYPFLEQNDGRSLLEDDTSKADEAKKETSELKSITSNNKQDSWIDGIKSRINDRKVQFKRKQDSAGFRIAPEEVKNSLIKPGDFSFLSPEESQNFIDTKQFSSDVPLKKKKVQQKNYQNRDKNKRFRLY